MSDASGAHFADLTSVDHTQTSYVNIQFSPTHAPSILDSLPLSSLIHAIMCKTDCNALALK